MKVDGPRAGWPILRRALCIVLLAASARTSAQSQRSPTDLTAISLEELMNIEITSVSKKEQRLSAAPAAVYVITQEDIRRSGATSIPEALRMVPGLHVARIDTNKWAITARGFNGRFANKLLVLMDGRSAYTPWFSGVYWEVQDRLLEDIDRIEVIRGPGATMWGANAVNGVINIITKNAKDTQGGLVTAGGGTEEQGFGGLRYGAKWGANTHYRVYSKYFRRNHLFRESGQAAADQWDVLRGGFRVDRETSRGDSLTLQGEAYDGRAGQTLQLPFLIAPLLRNVDDQAEPAGANVLGCWKHSFSDNSDVSLQFYFDRSSRRDGLGKGMRNTFDVDFQHRFVLSSRHEILWGLQYRFTADRYDNSLTLSFNPDHRPFDLFSGFAQDDIWLVGDRLRLTLGSKFEENDFSGVEILPTVRLAWMPNRRHTAWTAISRAARIPSRSESDIRLHWTALPTAGGPPNLLVVSGNPSFRSEHLLAYELGYRLQPSNHFSLDIASFYNVYRGLRTLEPGPPSFVSAPLPHFETPLRMENQMDGRTYGVEAATNWNMTGRWRWSAGYSWLGTGLDLRASSRDSFSAAVAAQSPRHQAHFQSYLDLPWRLQFDAALHCVDSLGGKGNPGYYRIDARLGWRPIRILDVSIGLENLQGGRHPEFVPELFGQRSEIGRSVYGKITWGF